VLQRWGGVHYPRSEGELCSWFGTESLDFLEWLRWPEGLVCGACGHVGGWGLGDTDGFEFGSYQTSWAMLYRLRSVWCALA